MSETASNPSCFGRRLSLSMLLCVSVSSTSWFWSGCATYSAGVTREWSPRPDQKGWIKEDLAEILARWLADESQREIGHAHDVSVARELRTIIDICYDHGSVGGRDPDGGFRAVNYLKREYLNARGDTATWRMALRGSGYASALHMAHRAAASKP